VKGGINDGYYPHEHDGHVRDTGEVLEVPPGLLGGIDDAWFRWVTDTGVPGPDRGQGGKYLMVPPDYSGELPEGGYYAARSRTYMHWWFGRMFLTNKSDPTPAVEAIRKFTKIYPYEPGGVGTPIAEFLAGKAKLGRVTPPPPTVFHEGTGKVMNTIPPNDWSYSATRALAVRATRRRRPSRTLTAPRRSTSARPSPRASSEATGSRPCPERAGGRSCASIARSSRSSPRPGAQARSN
jgi:hypothetical protein